MLKSYFTIRIGVVPAEVSTKWHPDPNERDPNFLKLTRGVFSSIPEAIEWARSNLNGCPYEIVLIKEPNF